MATLKMQGMEEYIEKLGGISKKSNGMIKRAVYSGAGEVLKEVESAIQAMPAHKQHYISSGNYLLNEEQKKGLLEGLGAAKMRNENGFVNTKIGFDGYNSIRTKKYPNGQPNALIARALESGTSKRAKTRFVAKATSKAKDMAIKAMAKQFDEDLKTMEG